MIEGDVRAERDGAVLRLTLNRPGKLNAFSTALVHALTARLHEARTDSAVRVVALTGSGRAFSAGADLEAMADPDREAAAAFVRDGAAMVDLIEGLGKPVVAALGGPTFGGGLEVALGCTVRLASERASLGLPEVVLGVMPGWGGTQRLARLVGRSRAALLALTGDAVDAGTASAWGLVDRVVDHEALDEAVMAVCQRIAGHRSAAVTRILEAVALPGGDIAEGLGREAELFRELFLMAETPASIAGFVEGRRSRRCA